MNILFVCTGNTCRSPIAENVMKKKILEENLDIEVKSAGIFAIDGDPYSEYARTIIREYTNITGHAQSVTEELLDWADLILTMTSYHKQALFNQYPANSEKVHTLKEYSSPGKIMARGIVSIDIADPYGNDLEAYRAITVEIEEAINILLEKYN